MTKVAPRFAGLQSALAEISVENSTRIARIRADARGEAFAGRLASTKRSAAEPAKLAARAVTPPAPARAGKASAPPKPLPLAIPADVAAKGPEAVEAYKRGHARAKARLAALGKHPAAVGRSAEVLSMFRAGKSDAEIVDHLTKDDRAAKATAVWERAIAAVYGTARDATENPSARESEIRKDSATDVWAKAYAKLGYR